jgi:hypothetical protein
VSQSGDCLGDRPDRIKPQGINGPAAKGNQDLSPVVLSVAVRVWASPQG